MNYCMPMFLAYVGVFNVIFLILKEYILKKYLVENINFLSNMFSKMITHTKYHMHIFSVLFQLY